MKTPAARARQAKTCSTRPGYSAWGLLAAQLLFAAYLVSAAPASAQPPAQKIKPDQPGLLDLEDKLEPFVAKEPRTEADEDRLEALALFAVGHTLERQHKFARALRKYQRALRCDPEAVTIARAIVPMAYTLKRRDEAIRYALKLRPDQMKSANSRMLRELGVYLTRRSDWDRAVQIFERAVASRPGTEETVADVLLHMEMGGLYHSVDKFDQGAESFQRVIRALDHPDEFGMDERVSKVLLGEPGQTFNRFGDCFLQAGQFAEAQNLFRRAHKADPNKGLFQYNMARVHHKKDKANKALTALEACFREHLDSEGISPYELLAKVLEDLGKQDELVGRLEKLRAGDEDNAPLGYFLAEQYRQAGELAKAESLFRELVQEKRTLTGFRALIDIYRKTDRPEPLLAVLGQAAAETGGLDVLGAEGEAVLANSTLIDTLIEIARKKYKADAESLDHPTRLAVALVALESKRFDVAAEFFDLALAAKPEETAELFLRWGAGLLLNEQAAEAAGIFQRAIDEKAAPDDNPAFYFYLAGALVLEEKADEALAAARAALKIRPDSARFRARVAWVLYYAKRNDQAKKAYRELTEDFDSDYDSPDARQVLREARLVLSNLAVLEDDLPQAEEWLQQVLDEFPDDVGAQNDLGYLWADQDKHLQRSLGMIRRAVEAEPENAAYRDSLGWIHYRLGNYKQAVEELNQAAGEQPDAIILDHLGDAYAKFNKPDEAREAWRRAADAFRKENDADKAEEVEKKLNGQQ